MPLIRLAVEYEGTAYAGWQRQRDRPTVQGELERAVRAVTGEEADVVGASRTDAGVHALGQVAHFATLSRIAPALTAHLPPDIAVRSSEAAPEGFHARRSAKGKVYRYVVWNAPSRPAIERRLSHHVPEPLDAGRMGRAAAAFVGRHDFRAFRRLGSAERNTVREIRSCEVRPDPPRVVIEVEGTAFLYAMARTMAGTLVEIGRGKMDPDAVPRLLAAPDRKGSGPTLPAKGLFLVRVIY